MKWHGWFTFKYQVKELYEKTFRPELYYRKRFGDHSLLLRRARGALRRADRHFKNQCECNYGISCDVKTVVEEVFKVLKERRL